MTPYGEGVAAAIEDADAARHARGPAPGTRPAAACPYAPGTKEEAAWERGYADGLRMARQAS